MRMAGARRVTGALIVLSLGSFSCSAHQASSAGGVQANANAGDGAAGGRVVQAGASGGSSGAAAVGGGMKASSSTGATGDGVAGSSGISGASGADAGPPLVIMPSAGAGGTMATTPPPAAGAGGTTPPATTGCGAGDAKLPPEPTYPNVCTTLTATREVAADAVPDESKLDTMQLQAALDGCAAGQAVKLVASASQHAFLTGPLTLPSGVTLWVDQGVTLYGTRDPKVYGSSDALISVSGMNSAIMGQGTIDGQGGEPMVGQSGSFWDQNGSGSGNSPALIAVRGAKQFTLYQINLHNSPKFHVKLGADGFVVWGVEVKTPSKSKNSQGTALTPSSAHNTDGIDPGEAASNGFIVCSKITVGDDHIAIKGSSGVHDLVIAHNHFGAGHGMSIGSEFQGGVSHVDVYDLSIDGTNTGLRNGSSNGIRIKSDSSRGGLVSDITYTDVCMREIWNPILLTPKYSNATGTSIPQYTNITFRNVRELAGSAQPKVTLDGYGPNNLNSVTLDNVIIDGLKSQDVTASYTTLTLGPGSVNFVPSGTQVSVTNQIAGPSTPNPCADRWVTF